MGFDVYRVPVTTTGTAGAATGSGRLALLRPGILRALFINYTSQPATTDVTIAQTIDGVTVAILTLTNINTDATFIPVIEAETAAWFNVPMFGGEITVTVAQGDAAANGVVVVLHVES